MCNFGCVSEHKPVNVNLLIEMEVPHLFRLKQSQEKIV